MRVKCTIEIDDETFSMESTGQGGEDAVVGRTLAAVLGAIDEVDGNLCLSFMLAEPILAAKQSPWVMRAAAQAWKAHDIEPTERDTWRLLVDASVWDQASAERDTWHMPVKAELEADTKEDA